ncbi:MAG: helix-hairpin-helix domain-containing protein [Thaumarchaeota archaeon]|nr:helix-hairpin-helix domain-containing protein [Nitrososphaerota archaeon]
MKFRIIIDEREKASGVPKELSKLGAIADYRLLTIGDYILSEDVGIERKSCRDLVASIYDGRLFEQLSQLSHHYAKSFLLLEGDVTGVLKEMKNPKVFFGAIASISLTLPISLLYAVDKEQTARIIFALATHLGRVRPTRPLVKGRRSGMDIPEEQLSIVSSFPGVGIVLAERLLMKFGSPRDIVSAQAQELAMVQGIGRARASKLIKILTEKFRTGSKIGIQGTLEYN